jgi:hypothetical protein
MNKLLQIRNYKPNPLIKIVHLRKEEMGALSSDSDMQMRVAGKKTW